MKFNSLHSFAISVALIATIGCGSSRPATYPVQGVVQFPDGKVLRGGNIEFESQALDPPIVARGAIGPDGTFVLGTYEVDDGAVTGQHKVVVISDYEIGNGAERPGMIPETLLHPKHRSYRTSGIVKTVEPKPNTLLIEVEYAEKANDSE
ncbi:hypothetical protein [Stieleria varia]|nr:hypothetical protein [Stieleria varia]